MSDQIYLGSFIFNHCQVIISGAFPPNELYLILVKKLITDSKKGGDYKLDYIQVDNFTAGFRDFHVSFTHTYGNRTNKVSKLKFVIVIHITYPRMEIVAKKIHNAHYRRFWVRILLQNSIFFIENLSYDYYEI